MSERVAYIGNFGPDHSTENHYARSFEAIGCTVVRIQENAEATPFDAIAQALEQIGKGVDLLLYTRTWGLDEARFQHLLAAAKVHGVTTAAVHLDRWQGLDREHEVTGQVMFRMEHVFTADGDAEETFWSERDVNHHWLSAGVLRDECVEADPFDRSGYPWDVAFVGSRIYHHEWPVRPALIDWLATTYGERFVHVGGDGQIPGGGRALRGGDLNRLYATIPVIVGDSCYARPNAHYWSDRFYETYGRGGFLIFPAIDALEDEIASIDGDGNHGFYPSWRLDSPVIEEPGRQFVLDDERWQAALVTLKATIDVALAEPEWREGQRSRLHRLVRDHCSYEARARTILETVGLRFPPAITITTTDVGPEECASAEPGPPATIADLENMARYQTHAAIDSIFDLLAAMRQSEIGISQAFVGHQVFEEDHRGEPTGATAGTPQTVEPPAVPLVAEPAWLDSEFSGRAPSRHDAAEAALAGLGE